jgi:hypothetical protein
MAVALQRSTATLSPRPPTPGDQNQRAWVLHLGLPCPRPDSAILGTPPIHGGSTGSNPVCAFLACLGTRKPAFLRGQACTSKPKSTRTGHTGGRRAGPGKPVLVGVRIGNVAHGSYYARRSARDPDWRDAAIRATGERKAPALRERPRGLPGSAARGLRENLRPAGCARVHVRRAAAPLSGVGRHEGRRDRRPGRF